MIAGWEMFDNFVAGVIIVVMIVARTKAMTAIGIALLAFFIAHKPPSQMYDVRDPRTRRKIQNDLPFEGNVVGKAAIGIGAAVVIGFIFLPSATNKKTARDKQAEGVGKSFVPGMEGRKESEAWSSSLNTARINAKQGAFEMGIRALETAVASGMDDPDLLQSDDLLEPLRQKKPDRFAKCVNKATKNLARKRR